MSQGGGQAGKWSDMEEQQAQSTPDGHPEWDRKPGQDCLCRPQLERGSLQRLLGRPGTAGWAVGASHAHSALSSVLGSKRGQGRGASQGLRVVSASNCSGAARLQP